MGIFVFQCDTCGAHEETVFTSWRSRPDTLPCEKCGGKAKYIIVSGKFDNHPIRGLLEDCSWLDEHAKTVSQEHYEGTKGNGLYQGNVMKTRKEFNDYLATKGIREKPGQYNRTEV
jgi:hypothetical protein